MVNFRNVESEQIETTKIHRQMKGLEWKRFQKLILAPAHSSDAVY